MKVAVAFALTRLGDDAVRARIESEIVVLARSGDRDDRVLAASMLGSVEREASFDRMSLRALLGDREPEVVNAALAAIHGPDDAELISEVMDSLDHRGTSGAAVDALVRIGDAALIVVDGRLRSDDAPGRHARELLVRVAREIGSADAVAVLRRHVEHRDREVGLAAMGALAALGPGEVGPDVDASAAGVAEPDWTAALVHAELEHATQVLAALVELGHEPAAATLRAALRDELGLVRRRVLSPRRMPEHMRSRSSGSMSR